MSQCAAGIVLRERDPRQASCGFVMKHESELEGKSASPLKRLGRSIAVTQAQFSIAKIHQGTDLHRMCFHGARRFKRCLCQRFGSHRLTLQERQ
jgi:hypothetical protein